MQIDRRLNLVLTVERADGSTLYVHSVPVRREVFSRYYMVIAQTFARIYAGGLGAIAAPRIAAMMLRDVAAEAGTLDGPTGVENGLFNEIKRTTTVIAPGANGWETLPYADAVSRKLLDEDDAAEVENAVAFFIVSSAMLKRKMLPELLAGMQRLWGGLFTSSSCTEYAAGLPMSIGAGSTGATATASSTPS